VVGGSPGKDPGTGTTVFPLPGSFPWSAGARGKRMTKGTKGNKMLMRVLSKGTKDTNGANDNDDAK
jgi:hypothetical protein